MTYKKITSLSNPIVKKAVDVKMRRRIPEKDFFLAEGPHIIEMAIEACAQVDEVFYTERFVRMEAGRSLLDRVSCTQPAATLIEVADNVFLRISDTESPQGILAVVACKSVSLDELQVKKVPLITVCDGIQDPGNLGTIIRVSDAADADAVVILPGTCDPFLPKTVRSTAGSIFNIPVIYAGYADLFNYMTARNISLYATDVRAERTLYEIDLRKPAALAFGNEARGMSESVLSKATGAVRIPVPGKAESLNAAIAAAVCLYEAVRQRTAASKIR